MSVNLNDDSKQFLCNEWNRAFRTVIKLRENLAELSAWKHQYLTSSGAYLGDIYKAVENTLRMLVEEIDGEKLQKNDRWHLALLERSYEHGLIPEVNYKTIRGMLNYRHFYVHGYAVELNEDIIRQRAPEAIEAFHTFVGHIQTRFDISFEYSDELSRNT